MSDGEFSHIGALVSNKAHLSTNEPHFGVHDTDQVSMVVKCGRVGIIAVCREWTRLPEEEGASLRPLLADLRGCNKRGSVQLVANEGKELRDGQWIHLIGGGYGWVCNTRLRLDVSRQLKERREE